MNNTTNHLKRYWLAILSTCLLCGASEAADETIDGKLTVTQDLKAGTSSSTNNFEFRANGLIISKGTYTGSWALGTNDQGTGTRFLWYPQLAAIRAGYVLQHWNDGYIGAYTAAYGYSPTAYGWCSTSFGYYPIAEGWASVAGGDNVRANGFASAAFNFYTIANGANSAAFGYFSSAEADSSAAFGSQSAAVGFSSAAFGEATSSDASHSVVIGRYNVGGGNSTNWVATDPLLEVGNGSSTNALSNALTVYKNGNAAFQGVVQAAPGGDVPMFSGQ
jgi:hypothetical protein